MKLHRVDIRVFCKPEDNIEEVEKGLLSLIPFDLDKEKIKLNKRNTAGFRERKIIILDVKLEKQRHVNLFLEKLGESLSEEQRDMIKSQAESRLDEDMLFYLRFDKKRFLEDKVLWLTDKGDCYHVKLSVAAFPKTRENALRCVKSLF